MAKAPKKPETPRQRDKRLYKAFGKLLEKVCTIEYGPGSYMHGHGEVIRAELRGQILQITIDSFDDPPVRSHLNLKLIRGTEA